MATYQNAQTGLGTRQYSVVLSGARPPRGLLRSSHVVRQSPLRHASRPTPSPRAWHALLRCASSAARSRSRPSAAPVNALRAIRFSRPIAGLGVGMVQNGNAAFACISSAIMRFVCAASLRDDCSISKLTSAARALACNKPACNSALVQRRHKKTFFILISRCSNGSTSRRQFH